MYDVTRRETFDSLGEIWMQEVDMYSTIENAIKMVVANKVDRVWVSTCWLSAEADAAQPRTFTYLHG